MDRAGGLYPQRIIHGENQKVKRRFIIRTKKSYIFNLSRKIEHLESVFINKFDSADSIYKNMNRVKAKRRTFLSVVLAQRKRVW